MIFHNGENIELKKCKGNIIFIKSYSLIFYSLFYFYNNVKKRRDKSRLYNL